MTPTDELPMTPGTPSGDSRQWRRQARAYAARELTSIYNQEWSGGKIVTELEFARRLMPASIEIHEQGYAEFHFKDAGLFSGHEVGVRIKADGSFQEAVIEG